MLKRQDIPTLLSHSRCFVSLTCSDAAAKDAKGGAADSAAGASAPATGDQSALFSK